MRRGVVAMVSGVAAAFVLAGCGGSGGISLPCNPQPHGQLCIKIFKGRTYAGGGRLVKDVIVYRSASNVSLAGKTWRIVLRSYPCQVDVCSARGSFPGPTRHGEPPRATSCRVYGTTTMVTTPTGCHDTLAQQMASFGDFNGFHVPKVLGVTGWLCGSEEIRGDSGWHTAVQPARVCERIG